MFVSDALGDHMVEAYSGTGLVMALYVASMVSLCLPHLVEVRTFSMLRHAEVQYVFEVYKCVQLNRCFVVCECVLQRGQRGLDGCG